jgi:hypothetical protein
MSPLKRRPPKNTVAAEIRVVCVGAPESSFSG